jgi:hypothetical protein
MRKIYDGMEFSHHGREFRVEFPDDDTQRMPWEYDDGRGVVERIRYSDYSRIPKAPGDVVLYAERGQAYLLKGGETRAKIKKEGWGLPPEDTAALAARVGRRPTRKQVEAECLAKEISFLSGFLHGQWSYVGVIVTDLETGDSDSLWGIESCAKDYLWEVAQEIANRIHPLADTSEASAIDSFVD